MIKFKDNEDVVENVEEEYDYMNEESIEEVQEYNEEDEIEYCD